MGSRSHPRPATASAAKMAAATPANTNAETRIRLIDLIHRRAAEAVRRADERTEQLAHVHGCRAVGQHESGAARPHEAASRGRGERAVKQSLRGRGLAV